MCFCIDSLLRKYLYIVGIIGYFWDFWFWDNVSLFIYRDLGYGDVEISGDIRFRLRKMNLMKEVEFLGDLLYDF